MGPWVWAFFVVIRVITPAAKFLGRSEVTMILRAAKPTSGSGS